MSRCHGWAMAMAMLLWAAAPLVGQDAETPAEPAGATNAEETLDSMMDELDEAPMIEPTDRPDTQDLPPVAPPVADTGADPAIIGAAPGDGAPDLRREGEFIVSRRGRLLRHADGAHMLFAFDAADRESPEPPMILQPCQMLQNMEQIVAERGDQVVFIVSGQVFLYRGANHVLPTMMKLALDQGNLQP